MWRHVGCSVERLLLPVGQPHVSSNLIPPCLHSRCGGLCLAPCWAQRGALKMPIAAANSAVLSIRRPVARAEASSRMMFQGVPRSLATATGKGGVGKTMLATSMGATWGKAGHRTLVVDCDPQASATLTLGIDPDEHGGGRQMVDAVMYGEPLRPVGSPGRPNLDVVPAGINTRHLVTQLAADSSAEQRFAAAFAAASDRYARVIFDCQPSVAGSRLAEVVLANAQYVLAPCTDQIPDIEGLRVLGDVMEVVGSQAVIIGVVLVRVQTRATAARRFAQEQITEVLGDADSLFESTVRFAPIAWRLAQENKMLPGEYAAAVEATPLDVRARIAGEQVAPPTNLRGLADDLEEVAAEVWRRLSIADRALRKLEAAGA